MAGDLSIAPRTTIGMLWATQLLALLRQISFQARRRMNWDYTLTHLQLTWYTIYDCHLITRCQTARGIRSSEFWMQPNPPAIHCSSIGVDVIWCATFSLSGISEDSQVPLGTPPWIAHAAGQVLILLENIWIDYEKRDRRDGQKGFRAAQPCLD